MVLAQLSLVLVRKSRVLPLVLVLMVLFMSQTKAMSQEKGAKLAQRKFPNLFYVGLTSIRCFRRWYLAEAQTKQLLKCQSKSLAEQYWRLCPAYP